MIRQKLRPIYKKFPFRIKYFPCQIFIKLPIQTTTNLVNVIFYTIKTLTKKRKYPNKEVFLIKLLVFSLLLEIPSCIVELTYTTNGGKHG